jgi:hypothetical protein
VSMTAAWLWRTVLRRYSWGSVSGRVSVGTYVPLR